MTKNTITISGAFFAWVLGSGFATGQEILQFFTSYGYKSYIVIFTALIAFSWVGITLLKTGFEHIDDNEFSQTEYYCGKKLGKLYDIFIPAEVFAALIVIFSGAGATVGEYYGIDHHIGTIAAAVLAFSVYLGGFGRLVKMLSFIGPIIILFTIIVGILTCISDIDNICAEEIASLKPSWIGISGLLYAAYNITGGSFFYTNLGKTAFSKKEAMLGALLGSIVLLGAIAIMNTAMLSNIEECKDAAIPALFLADKISPLLGGMFSIVLLLGMFSTSSSLLWTFASAIGKENKRKGKVAAATAAFTAMIIGFFPFTDLIGTIYPYMGYICLVYIFCVMIKGIRGTNNGMKTSFFK